MRKTWVQNQRGIGLPEAIVSVAIIGTAVITFVAALSAGSIAVREGDKEVVAQRLALNQLEYIKSCPYDTTYSIVDKQEGYNISVEVDPTADNDADIQKVSVTISRDGEDVLTVESFKVNR